MVRVEKAIQTGLGGKKKTHALNCLEHVDFRDFPTFHRTKVYSCTFFDPIFLVRINGLVYIGENLQENPIFNGKNHGFLKIFP